MSSTARRLIAALAIVALHAGAPAQQQTVTRSAQYVYDQTTGQLLSETVDPGGSHCVQTQHVYDAYGNRIRTAVSPCASTSAAASFEQRITLHEYAAKTDGPAALRYTAGAFVTRTRTGRAAMEGGAEPAGTEARFEHHPGFGTVLSQTAVAHQNAALNLTTRTEPDSFGRVLKEYAPVKRNADGSVVEVNVEQRITYCHPTPAAGCINYTAAAIAVNDATRLLSGQSSASIAPRIVSAYFVEAVPSDGSLKKRVHYDSLHRQIAQEAETHSGQWSVTLTAHDNLGLVIASWSAYIGRDANGAFIAPPGELRQWTAARDYLHRPLDQRHKVRLSAGAAALEQRTELAYNGLETRATTPGDSTPDGQPRTRIARKHASGQTAQTVDPYGATLNTAFDPVGNPLETVDALGNRTTIGYTPGTARFKIAMTDPDQGTWTYEYDALGQLKKQTDAKAQVTELQYDVLGRVTAKLNPTQNTTWYHDKDAAGAWCAGGLNRLCESKAGNSPVISRTQLAYDNLARPTQTTRTLDRAYVSQATYDDLGRVSTQRYPSGFTIKHEYSAKGVLQKVSDNANASRVFWRIDTVTAADVFDAKGNLKRSQLGNGIGTNHQFDPITGRAFTLRAGTGSTMTSALDHAYSFDAAGNVGQRIEGHLGVVESFSHDRLDRLTQYGVASTSDTAAFRTVNLGYNAIGNLIDKSDLGGYSYPSSGSPRPHAVQSAAGTSYSYDANGQLQSTSGAQSRSHTWTAFNQPATLSLGAKSASFTYDESYKRIKEVVIDGGSQRTVYYVHPDNAGGLAFEREETRANGTLTRNESRHYISVGGQVVAVVKTLNDSATVSTDPTLTNYWHKDALGSIVAVTDANGNVLERMAFDPWGRRLRDTGRLDPWFQGPAHGDRGFTGHEHIDELALVHMNGRVYDPQLARFFSPDPIIQAPDALQNYDRYSYVLNGPLKYTDPSGHCFEAISATVCAAMKAFAVVGGTAMALEGNKYWKIVGSVAMAWGLGGLNGVVEKGLGVTVANSPIANAMIAGGLTGLTASGGNLEAGMLSALTAGAFSTAGSSLSGPRLVLAHALIGCVSSAASGGKCGPGAMAAAFAKLATTKLELPEHSPSQFIVVTLVGGTASVIGGGKFANGAVTAAAGYLFNELAHQTTAAQRGYARRTYWDGTTCPANGPCYNHLGIDNARGTLVGVTLEGSTFVADYSLSVDTDGRGYGSLGRSLLPNGSVGVSLKFHFAPEAWSSDQKFQFFDGMSAVVSAQAGPVNLGRSYSPVAGTARFVSTTDVGVSSPGLRLGGSAALSTCLWGCPK